MDIVLRLNDDEATFLLELLSAYLPVETKDNNNHSSVVKKLNNSISPQILVDNGTGLPLSDEAQCCWRNMPLNEWISWGELASKAALSIHEVGVGCRQLSNHGYVHQNHAYGGITWMRVR